jgi:predicted nucleic acid-binding protein
LICVDASVAVKWALAEDRSDTALSLYAENQADGIVGPPFLRVEVANAIWRRVPRGLLSPVEAQQAFATFLNFEVELAAPPDLFRIAFDLAARFNRPAVYDMHYVALAQIAGCELWTADQRLLNALDGRLPFVKPLGSFEV